MKMVQVYKRDPGADLIDTQFGCVRYKDFLEMEKKRIEGKGNGYKAEIRKHDIQSRPDRPRYSLWVTLPEEKQEVERSVASVNAAVNKENKNILNQGG